MSPVLKNCCVRIAAVVIHIRDIKGSGAMILLLTIASGLTGILLARSFRVFALIPAMLLIAVAAFFLGRDQGMSVGLIAFALGAAAIQICYFVSMVIIVLI